MSQVTAQPAAEVGARQRPACSPPQGRPAATGLGQLALATDASMLALAVLSAEVWAHVAATRTAWGWAAGSSASRSLPSTVSASTPPTPSPPRHRHLGRGRPGDRVRDLDDDHPPRAGRRLGRSRRSDCAARLLCGGVRRRRSHHPHPPRAADASFGLVRLPRLDCRRRARRPASREAPRDHPEFGLRPIGFLDKDPLDRRRTTITLPVLGASWDLDRVVAEHGVEHVIVDFSTAPTRRATPADRALPGARRRGRRSCRACSRRLTDA